jgi:hypothetical protein
MPENCPWVSFRVFIASFQQSPLQQKNKGLARNGQTLVFVYAVSLPFEILGKLFSKPAIYLQLFEKNQTSTVIADIQAAIGDFDIDTF